MRDLIFVYGTLKRGFAQHKLLLGKTQFIANGWVKGKLYKISYYPGAKLSKSGKIYGEIYKIKKPYLYRLLKELDEYEEIGYKFTKPFEYKRVVAKAHTKNTTYNVWFYEYQGKVDKKNLIKSGIFK